MTSHLFDDLRSFVEADTPLFDGDLDRALATTACLRLASEKSRDWH